MNKSQTIEPDESTESPGGTTAQILRIKQELESVYGKQILAPDFDPISGLVATILSQHTSDLNSGRAYESLRHTLPTWEMVRNAPVEDIAAAIRTGGLANVKAKRIKDVLNAISDEAEFSADQLRCLGKARSMEYLTRLPGVGEKTAACVLLFSLGMAAMPVDTHVQRVAIRTGMAPPEANPSDTREILEHGTGGSPEAVYSFHVNLIRHGRQICKAGRPLCPQCVIRSLCNYENKTS